MDIRKDNMKYLRLCGLEQSGIVQVNAQMNGKLTMNKSQPRAYFTVIQQPFSTAGYAGTSAETAFKHGHTLIVAPSSSNSMVLVSVFSFMVDSGRDWIPSSGGNTLPFASTCTTVTVGRGGGGVWAAVSPSIFIISDRRRISLSTCPCAIDLILMWCSWPPCPAELRLCTLISSVLRSLSIGNEIEIRGMCCDGFWLRPIDKFVWRRGSCQERNQFVINTLKTFFFLY